jgi:hypothetical protein
VPIARAEGDATVHASSLLHAVSRIRSGVRHSLIVFYHSTDDDGGSSSAAGATGTAPGRGSADFSSSAEARRRTHEYLVAGVEGAARANGGIN